MPAGTLVTVPVPVPARVMVKVRCGWNVAVQLLVVVIVTVPSAQSPLPPVNPVNVEPGAATAVSTSTAPCGTVSVQSLPQSMPGGELVTVPEPVPALVTVSVLSGWKVAVHVLLAVSVTTPSLQSPLAPENPVKVDPGAGDALSVTTVPFG